MSTLAEIERAADELPAPQVEQLIAHLSARLQRERAERVPSGDAAPWLTASVGTATTGLTTDEIMRRTRGEE